MAKLYVANVSLQNQIIMFRAPGERAPRSQMVETGGQVQMSGEFLPEDVAAFVEQHGPYGLAEASVIGQRRNHTTMIYKVGAPVSKVQMQQALDRNLVLMGERGKENRAAAVAGVADIMQKYRPDKYNGTDVSFEEVRSDGGQPTIDEHVVISPENRRGFIDRTVAGHQVAPQPRKSRRSRHGAPLQ